MVEDIQTRILIEVTEVKAKVEALQKSIDVQWEKHDELNGRVDDQGVRLSVVETEIKGLNPALGGGCSTVRQNVIRKHGPVFVVGGGTCVLVLEIVRQIVEAMAR